MHKSITAIFLVVALVAGYGIGYITAPKGAKMEHVTIILNWSHTAEKAGIYAADDLGYYAEEGLSVTILRGYGSADTALRVEVGEGEFGFVDMGTHILAEAAGEVDLLQVAMGFHKSPIGVMWLPDTPITEPKDLEGKKIASTPASSAYLMFTGPFAEVTGLDVDSITFDFSAPYAKTSLLFAGTVDAMTGYSIGDGPEIEAQVGGVGMMVLADYGVDMYSNGIVVKDSYAAEHPGIVRRFVRATLKGWGWALNNQEASVDMCLRLFPELDEVISELQLEYTLESLWNAETQAYGIGYMIPEKVENTINLVKESFDITTDILPEQIYSNEFVEGLPDEILFPG